MVNEYLLETLKEEGRRLAIPSHKDGALIREYLQSKIIYYLYEEALAKKLSFMGGTSLRILRELDRFSEDLDFDNLGLKFPEIQKLFSKIAKKMKKEGFEIDYKMKKTNNSGIGEMKFKNLLFQLKISPHPDEKLNIKLNYTTPKIKPETEISVLNRFGLVQSVLTNTLEWILVQKCRAILQRRDLQPRDFYDVVWLLSRNVKPKMKPQKELFERLKEIYDERIKPNLPAFKNRLRPFLINENNIYYLDIFGDLMAKLSC